MRSKKKALELEQKGFLTFDDPPLDGVVIDHSQWEHANYVINRTLEDFELYPKEAPQFYSRGLPFLDRLKRYLNQRAINQNRSFAPHEESEPTRAALTALHTLQGLLEDNGVVNPEKAKVFLLSFQLLLAALHTGNLRELFVQEVERYAAYRCGPGATSREAGSWTEDAARKVLEKYGGYRGYKALPRGEKTPVREEIQRKIQANDIRNVDNIIKKIGAAEANPTNREAEDAEAFIAHFCSGKSKDRS